MLKIGKGQQCDEEEYEKVFFYRTVCIILIIGCIITGVYSYYGGIGTGKCANVNEFEKYAVTVENLSIPEQTKIVALGEATHGNKEFQQLKLDIFKIMVEDYGVRAFSLEGDYGGCEAVNRYIHGGDGTVKDAVSAIWTIFAFILLFDIWILIKKVNPTYTASFKER